MKPSITSIFSFLFLLFIANSIWNLLKIFQKPECTEGEPCYHSYLNTKPKLELLLYITDNSRSGNSLLLYDLDNFNYEETFEKELQIDISKTVRNNGSLFLHTVIIPNRKFKKELTLAEAVKITEATYMKNRLTQYAIPRSTTFNLLKEETKSQSVKPVTHLKSRFAIVMCTDELYIPHNAIPAEIIGHMRINNRREFLPLVHQDFMQTRLRDLVEITSESRSEKVVFKYSPTSYGKLRFLLQIESALNQFLTLGFTLKDLDEIKGVFADTNVYLLCATVFIGSIHLLLDFLSFKNDVSFWKSHRSMAGLSTRTVLWRAFSQTVVFLYLLDEGTSLIVLIPAAIGTVIEFWKVKKVLKATISWRGMKFDENKTESEAEAVTRQYDEESMKYLSYLLYPLCICAAIYSLIYQPHKSWYSWTINSLVNGVYAFGFLFMLPQLFVNYRLKSVAALPWRAFTYRAFNTFIDDIFAFIITMPTAHRVACFRDDVVFLIYLYQRWLYPVDKNRIDDVVSEESTSSTPIEDKKSK